MPKNEKTPHHQKEANAVILENNFPLLKEQSEERMLKLLSSFNGTPKAVTLLLLPTAANTYITPAELGRRFRDIFKGTEIAEEFRSASEQSRNYVRKTLVPVGLVAEEYTVATAGGEELIGYGLTEGGRKYGSMAAALAISFEDKHKDEKYSWQSVDGSQQNRTGISLFEVLGGTHSAFPEERAPYRNAQVLTYLYQQTNDVRIEDIEKALGKESLSEILEKLHNAGVVSLSSLNFQQPEKGVIAYSLTGKPASETMRDASQAKYPVSNKSILEACSRLTTKGVEITPGEIYEELFQGQKLDEATAAHYRHLVGNFTAYLANKGYLARSEYTGRKKSSVRITPRGQHVVHDFFIPLQKIVENDATAVDLAHMVEARIRTYLPNYAKTVSRLYYPFSHSFKLKDRVPAIQRLIDELGMLRENEWISAADLAARIGRKANTTNKMLSELEEQGLLEVKNPARRGKGFTGMYRLKK